MNFHPLTISAIHQPIKEATTISFDLPQHLQEAFTFHPGQHLTLKFNIEGQEVRRTYSLNSCPLEKERIQITVKRVKGGLVSNYINEHLAVGDVLEVMPPQGRFYAPVNEEEYKTYFLFAAGSGITPIISILKTVLQVAPNSAVNLFYGNTNQDSIIFEKEFNELQQQYSSRLQIVFTLSDPKVWTTWQQWQGRKGRIDASAVEWFITNHPPLAQNTEYYICGPGAMNTSVRSTLLDLGIPREQIHFEQFGGAEVAPSQKINAVDQAQLKVTLNGQSHQLVVPKGQTVLQTLKAAKVNPPYSCESGVCGTCVAKITKGQAAMKACMALEEKEIAAGYVLSCQALPTTKVIEMEFGPG